MIENNSNSQFKGQLPINQVNELSIRDYLFILRFHYKKVLLLTIIGLGIGFYSALTKPPSYRATATVVVQEKPGVGMIMDLTGNRDRNRMTNEIQLIKSRSVAKDAIKEIWLHKKNSLALFGSYPFYPRGRRARLMAKEIMTLGLYNPSSDEPLHYDDEYSDQIGERFAGSLINRLSINNRAGTNIIDISYTSVWPEEAKLIVNTVAEVYQILDLKWSGENAQSSVQFLQDLVQKEENKLSDIEKELTHYKKQERMYNLDGNAIGITSQIGSIEGEIYNSISEINIRQEKYNHLKSKLSNDEKNLADQLMNNINIQVISLRNEISQLEAQLIQNIAQYGENHGAVKDLKLKMQGLKIQLNTKVTELTKQGIIVQDPLQARQDIVMELIALDSEIMGIKLKKNESEKLLIIFERKLDSLPPKQLEFSRLQRNSIVLNQNYSLLRQKLEEAKINVASQVGKVQIVDYARTPGNTGQNHKRTILMGLIFGFGAGIALALGLEFLDNTIKTTQDIERKNLAVLGIIPSIGEEQYEDRKKWFSTGNALTSSKSSRKLKRRLITHEDPRSPVSEAYRSLRTSMLYSSSADKKIKSILVSSAGPGEGKTTTVANLAITYANLGKKTILIDTDLRRPVIHKVLEIKKEPGITDYLSGATDDFNDIIQKTAIENLFVVPSGIIPPNPSELLGSQRMADLLRKLETEWDMILFDSPPLVAVTDATMVSKEIDQIVMVVKVGQTDKKAFDHTITSLRNVHAPLGGVILNAVTHKNSYGSYYYYYQYYHYYGSDKEST
jgi:capsular exopolysaccharide synthesis family protein